MGYGSHLAGIQMQSPNAPQNSSFHSMSPTGMMQQETNPNLMQSDIMLQSPQQYPQQHVAYGNSNYHAYRAAYPNQRHMAQTQLSPAAYQGGYEQDGGYIGGGGEFNAASPHNQGMIALRSPGVPVAMTAGQSMYYSNNIPYRGNSPVSPLAQQMQQGGFSGSLSHSGIPSASAQSMPTPDVPQMSAEQAFVSSPYSAPSPTQKQVQGGGLSGFFQPVMPQPMSAPIRPHQVRPGNIPPQSTASPLSQVMQQEMGMYTMSQDTFQQQQHLPPFSSAGADVQLQQQRSCMYADRSASSALQQIYQAQQLKVKAQGGSIASRRASYPGQTNHSSGGSLNLPKSPNPRSTPSPQRTPSPKVRSPRQKASAKAPSPSQNAERLNRASSPLSPKTLSPETQNVEQNVGVVCKEKEAGSPRMNSDPNTGLLAKKEQAKASPPLSQVRIQELNFICRSNRPFAGPGRVTYPPLSLRPGTL